MSRKQRTLPYPFIRAICADMELVLKQGEDGFWTYDEGYNDARMLKEFNQSRPDEEQISLNQLMKVRNECFGQLRLPRHRGTATRDAERIRARLAELETAVSALQEEVRQLRLDAVTNDDLRDLRRRVVSLEGREAAVLPFMSVPPGQGVATAGGKK